MCKLLDKWGLEEIRGKKTSPQFVDRILGRYLKFYAGIIVNPWTQEEIQGLHKPMISRDEMYQIQLVRSGKANLAKRNKYNPAFPLRRTIKCFSCGKPLTGSYSRGRSEKYPYYHCVSRSCSMYGKGIAKETLERDFMNYLSSIIPQQKFLEVFKATVLDLWEEKGKCFDDDAKKHEKRLEILTSKRKRIFEMREEGSYTKEEFIERREEIENEIAVEKIELSETRIEQFDIEGALVYATNFISKLDRQWFDLQPNLRPRLQKLVFPEGISYQRNQGFGTAKLGLIFLINQSSVGKKSQVMDPSGIEPLSPRCKRGVLAIRLRAHVRMISTFARKLIKIFFLMFRYPSSQEKILIYILWYRFFLYNFKLFYPKIQ